MASSLIEPLRWFPKQFRAGDMDGTGGDRLLGRTELSRLEVLVRETAQNSWDARSERQAPLYGIHLRRVDFRLRADIDRLFVEGRHVSGRHHVPSAKNIHILEVFDRGTCGLDGPVDLSPTSAGEPCNFQDLILKVGVPRDDGKGGGTYGFGKTAAYAFSEQGTVIFWSRCRNPLGILEHRLVVSALHESYVSEGRQFTGRHWWGAGEGDLVAPLVGAVAQRYGEQLFARHFHENETGTSLLIIDPGISVPDSQPGADPDPGLRQHGDARAMELAFEREARRAIRLHLWPKLVTEPGQSRPPMPIELRVHERDVPLQNEPGGALDIWAAALNAIRLHSQGESSRVTSPAGLPVEVHDVIRHRKVIGHLAIAKRIRAIEVPLVDDDLDPSGDEDGVRRIALMRDQAELVVTTDDWSDHTASTVFDWVAVFKSAREWDRTFADAEPPAHDMWVSNAGGETGLVVRAMRNRVRAILREAFRLPEVAQVSSGVGSLGVGAVARRFGLLLPAASQAVKDVTSSRGRARARTSAPRNLVTVEAPRLVETLGDGRQRQEIAFAVNGEGEYQVQLIVSLVGDDGARKPLSAEVLLPDWGGASDLGDARAKIQGGVQQVVTITGPARRALLIEMNASVADGGN